MRADTSKVECWGNSSLVNNNVPASVTFSEVSVGPTTSFSSVSVSSAGACGIRADNKNLECWGSVTSTVWGGVAWAPKNIAFDRVSLDDTSACGVLSGSGRLVCWGAFSYNPQFQ